MGAKKRTIYSPHHWVRCPVHGAIPVHRDMGEETVRLVEDEHKDCRDANSSL